MSLNFDLSFDSTEAIPPDLQSLDLYVKLVSMINYIVLEYAQQFQDVSLKYSGPSEVRYEVITNIINEFGFTYITNLMGTITNYEFNTLLSFISLLNLLKGSKQGLELILILLGFDSVITEWWQTEPQGEPYTFALLLLMNTSYVQNPIATVDAVKVFVTSYVFPLLTSVNYIFSFNFASADIAIAGFSYQHASSVPGSFLARVS